VNRVRQIISRLFLFGSLLGALLATDAFAGGNDANWRPVSPAELAMKTPAVEPDADAEAIFWDIWIDDKGDGIKLNNYVRVKIFTDRGREKYSKFNIPFGPDVKIKDLAARVIRPDGSIVEISEKDIFDREIIKAGGVKIKAKSFAIPNIEPGVIIEYKYREVREFGGAYGMKLQFQQDIPVEELAYYYKPSSKEPVYQTYNLTDTKFVRDTNGYFVARRNNVPAFKEEPFMPPVRPWMLLTGDQEFRFGSFSLLIKDRAQDPDTYWAGVAFGIAPYAVYMNKASDEIRKKADNLTSEIASPDEKLRKLYEFCQKEIINLSYDRTLSDEERKKLPPIKEVSDILGRKAAGYQSIDYLFGALAHSIGFETRIAYTSSRRESTFVPDLANQRFLHRAGIAINVNGEWRLFKPGIFAMPYGMLQWYEEGQYALLVGEKQYSWTRTPVSAYERSAYTRTAKLHLLEDGTLEGEIRIELRGHPANLYRLSNYDETDQRRQDLLKDEIKYRISGAEVSDIKVENPTDSSKLLIESYKVRIPAYAQRTGKRLFLQPGYFYYGTLPLFSSNVRKYDISFRYPWSENDLIEIVLPKGYSLEDPDTPGLLTDPGKIGSDDIRMTVNKDAGVLRYSRKFYFGGGNNVDFPVIAYEPLKQLFDAVNLADAHTVTLKQN
jgi:hypothetical protein